MKRKKLPLLIRFTLLSALVVFCFSTLAVAQQLRGQSPTKALEYSLKNLYDSASEVSKKNNWLKQEISKMGQEVTFLRGEMRSLETSGTKKRISSVLDDKAFMKDIPWEEERLNMMYQDFIELDEESRYLQDRLTGKKNDQKDIEADLKNLTKEVNFLTKQRDKLAGRAKTKIDKKSIGRVKETLKRSGKSLKYAERKLKRLEGRHGGSLREFSKIKDRNIELKGRVAFLTKKKEMIEGENARLKDDIGSVTFSDKDKLAVLNNEVKSLRAQKKKLKRALEKAENKLGKDFNTPDYKEHVDQMRGNIDAIRDENLELKKELNRLEGKLNAAQ